MIQMMSVQIQRHMADGNCDGVSRSTDKGEAASELGVPRCNDGVRKRINNRLAGAERTQQ
jgi:hypothetical protein